MAVLLATAYDLSAQTSTYDATQGISQAKTEVQKYFNTGIDLSYAVGAVLGIVGAVKVYQKWNAGDQDTMKTASAWFGSCIFLLVVATTLRGFFNVPA